MAKEKIFSTYEELLKWLKEGANIIAESINSSADSDATALAQFGDVLCREAFVNLKGYKL